ncbi:MAG: transposase [Pyrinomonadaceae bacterium]
MNQTPGPHAPSRASVRENADECSEHSSSEILSKITPEEPALHARARAIPASSSFLMNKDPRYWHSRGYLPHFHADGLTQFITFRLADSMPQTVLKKWRDDLAASLITDADFRRRIETYLDQNYGSAALKDPRIAKLVQETLLKWDGERYRLFAWVIMPNHVHLLLEAFADFSIADIMHSIKSYTAHEANRILDRRGQFWSKEYFERYIRDSRHFHATVRYIEDIP